MKNDELPSRVFEWMTRIGFGAIAAVLALFALVMIAYAIGQTAHALVTWQDFGLVIMQGVGYAVVAVAVFEVAKYLIEEEVMRGRKLRSPAEARRSLTKFIATISIALFSEGLVTVFRVGHTAVHDLIYPIMLLLTAIILVLGLGLFQRLSVSVEDKVDNKEEAEANR